MSSGSVPKSKRGKHRWVGLEVSSDIQDRKEFKHMLESSDEIPSTCRVYDFSRNQITGKNLAIIRIPLQDYNSFREILGDDNSVLVKSGIKSITSSGKIKLVRERLNLKRPKRKR